MRVKSGINGKYCWALFMIFFIYLLKKKNLLILILISYKKFFIIYSFYQNLNQFNYKKSFGS